MEGISHAQMSIMTFRQKIIRVSASAAICGLSISFALGEMIDQKALLLADWKEDAHFFPAGYSPLKPIFASKELLSTDGWKQSLVVSNSVVHEQQFVEKLTFKLAAPRISPNIYKEETKVAVVPQPIAQATSPQQVLPPPPPVAQNVNNSNLDNRREVEAVMLSIHTATANLNPSAKIKISDPDAKVVTSQEVGVKKAANEEVIIGETATNAVTPSASAPTTMRASSNTNASSTHEGVWEIQGKILTQKQEVIPSGHFEVGIYSKIDSEGLPIGAPIIQQILPAGKTEFKLSVPQKLDRTFLFGEFVADKGGKRTLISPSLNPIERSGRIVHYAELNFKVTDTISSVAAAALLASDSASSIWRVRGKVTTMFVRAGAPTIPQEDVIVKVRGRKESARTDKNGEFTLELPKLKGEVALEFLKAGYHPSIHWASYPAKSDIKVELASREAVEKLLRNFNGHQVSTKGVFIGRAAAGLSAQMSLKAEGPYYFGENGFPDSSLKATSLDGRFIFFNIEPGIGFLEASMAGENIAPISLSIVEGGQLVSKNLQTVQGKIKGRVFNPVATQNGMLPISGARLRIEGTSEWSNTDSYGAFTLGPMKFFQGEKVAIEFSSEKFSNHRYVVSPAYIEQKNELNLFAFTTAYVSKLANSMDIMTDAYTGIILGKVSNLSVRIDAMAEHSVANGAKDFYFDAKGKLQGAHAMTDPRFGTFMIFNVPKGNTLLQGSNAMGQLQFFDSVASYPATISVVME